MKTGIETRMQERNKRDTEGGHDRVFDLKKTWLSPNHITSFDFSGSRISPLNGNLRGMLKWSLVSFPSFSPSSRLAEGS